MLYLIYLSVARYNVSLTYTILMPVALLLHLPQAWFHSLHIKSKHSSINDGCMSTHKVCSFYVCLLERVNELSAYMVKCIMYFVTCNPKCVHASQFVF